MTCEAGMVLLSLSESNLIGGAGRCVCVPNVDPNKTSFFKNMKEVIAACEAVYSGEKYEKYL